METRSHKVLIFLACWKRPEITEICFMGIQRLIKSGVFEMEAFAVISEETMIPLCEKYGVEYCLYKNNPVGEKKNYGLNQALKKDWDYILELGSDDLIKTELLKIYEPLLGHKHVLSMDHFVYLNSENGDCRRYKTKSSFGIGRMISRAAVEHFKGNLWNSKFNQGLDNSSNFLLARHGYLEKRILSDKPLGIDLKSKDNIWPFNYLTGVEYSLEETLEGYSEAEKEAIESLIGVYAGE